CVCVFKGGNGGCHRDGSARGKMGRARVRQSRELCGVEAGQLQWVYDFGREYLMPVCVCVCLGAHVGVCVCVCVCLCACVCVCVCVCVCACVCVCVCVCVCM